MRPIRLGLLAALIIAVMAPGAAMAAGKTAASVVSDASRKAGMAEMPALIAAGNIPCTLSDARLIGKAAPDKKTGSPGSSLYEVACGAGNMGYLIQAAVGSPPNAYSCLEANYPADPAIKAANPCLLAGNTDPLSLIGPLLSKAKVPCTPEKARGIGQTKTSTLFEVACPGGTGYIVTGSGPLDLAKPATATNCLAYDDAQSSIKCILYPPAARLVVVDHFAQLANNGCTIKDRRYVGLFISDGTEGYEVACTDGKGYIYKVNGQGGIASILDCAKVAAGGCTLTDTRAATAEQAGLYTKLAKAAGSSCQVSRYAVFPSRGTDEVVELVCGDGVGAIGMFPAVGKGQVLDCGHALVAGYRCTLGKSDYSGLTADLRKFDQKECAVSAVGQLLKAPDGSFRLEVACSDGLPGYMIGYTNPTTPKEAIGCRFAGSCVLPTNKAGAAPKG
ncbi:hypothetical protein [Phenylobacterium sp.]|uniref:hypothetical protein n=1 Tax=Phenylobacterium sp. TaxID=1871053 RepID=UPI00286B5683|nr:hypothetical protein [Phenylobacterium sp.]